MILIGNLYPVHDKVTVLPLEQINRISS